MGKPARIVAVEHLGGRSLRLSFDDGVVRDLDFEPMLHGGSLDQLRDVEIFAQAYLDEVAGTVAWPEGFDFDPDVLHGDFQPATGPGPTVLAERHLRPTR
ncbi:MAG: DUF2442 domain-containing protein [Acidimicrobiales bacterium]